MSLKFVTVLTISLLTASPSFALMSVNDLKEVFAEQGDGSPTGVAYVQGVFEGLVALEAAHRSEGSPAREFCRLFDLLEKGETPNPHVATLGPWLIEGWQKQGQDMDAPFVDVMISYLSGNYGC